MFGFKYMKFDSMDFVIQYQNGKVKREGAGLAFFYFAPNSSIVRIPLKSIDLPFIFNEVTSDFQEVTVQGQLTFKVVEPKKLGAQLDFTVNDNNQHVTDDFEKLTQRLVNEAQTAIANLVHQTKITGVLNKQVEIQEKLVEGLKESEILNQLGVEALSVNVLAIKAQPEMARALEATTREGIQQEADKAIYDRRNFAVEQERKIKESEMNTDIAVEDKQRQIVEKQMETDIVKQENQRKLKEMEVEAAVAVEEKNKELVAMRVENDKKEADAKEYLLKGVLNAYKDIDWKVLTAINSEHMDAGANIALAFRELAGNTDKIGTLNITPDLLDSLLTKKA
tara:strand:+ start:2050 stop:3063 length:1014 start_codon:yes stop_codon:yes gene_type:complete